MGKWFYFRFIEPNLELGLTDVLWNRISEQFRAFVGMTAFEDLCREWTLAQARAGRLPFAPELVGSHWSPEAQVDVVAINWRDRAILLGERKWGTDAVGRNVIRELVGKMLKVAPDENWQVHYIFFARAGFTDAARAEAETAQAALVDLETLDVTTQPAPFDLSADRAGYAPRILSEVKRSRRSAALILSKVEGRSGC